MSDQQWIVVRNWADFQHYKDAWPTWIKFYAGLLHDPNWTDLPESTRLLLAQLFLVYASARAQVPLSTRWLSRQLNMRVTSAQLERLNHAGWIEFSSRPCLEHVKSASSPRATRANALARTPLKGSKERRGANAPTGAAPDANKNGRRRDPYELAEAFTRNTLINYPESDRRIALAEYHLTHEQEDQLLTLAANLEADL